MTRREKFCVVHGICFLIISVGYCEYKTCGFAVYYDGIEKHLSASLPYKFCIAWFCQQFMACLFDGEWNAVVFEWFRVW